MKVVIDGVEYVPKVEIPFHVKNERLYEALRSLTAIQYFADQKHKHRAMAWDALEAIAPDLAALDPKVAYDRVREGDE